MVKFFLFLLPIFCCLCIYMILTLVWLLKCLILWCLYNFYPYVDKLSCGSLFPRSFLTSHRTTAKYITLHELFTFSFLGWLLNFLVEFTVLTFSPAACFASLSWPRPMRNENILQSPVHGAANHPDFLMGGLSWLSFLPFKSRCNMVA